jgi:MoaA/NifB/PqqE/SkfB family radical SAM enzyme
MLEMTVERVEKILDLAIARRCLAVILSGGEPLLNERLSGIIGAVKRRKKQCWIITNGILLAERMEELKRAMIDEVQVSIYNNTLDDLKNILPRVAGGITINASYVLTRSTLEREPKRIDDVIALCKASGCRSLKFALCAPFKGNDSETIFDDCEIYKELLQNKSNQNDTFRVFYPPPVKRELFNVKEKACRLPWQRLMVDALGRGVMCCVNISTDGSELFFDVFSDDERQSYNSYNVVELRKKLLANDLSVPDLCKSCPHLPGSFSSRI